MIEKKILEQGNRTSHRQLAEALCQIEEEQPDNADIIMMGPPTGGQDSDLETENEELLYNDSMPSEVAGELEVFNLDNNELSEEEATETAIQPSSKKLRKEKKKEKPTVNWEKKHIKPKEIVETDPNKDAQSKLLEIANNVGATIWSSFENVFTDIAHLLVAETNRYASREKTTKF